MDGEAVAGHKKNARRRRAWILFQDESGVSERPPVRRTWAPKGETPVLVYAFNWKKLSISAALSAIAATASDAGCGFRPGQAATTTSA